VSSLSYSACKAHVQSSAADFITCRPNYDLGWLNVRFWFLVLLFFGVQIDSNPVNLLFSLLWCATWGVPSEVCHLRCHLRCAIWGVLSEVCHLGCAIWCVPSEVCHLRCAIWGVSSEVCHLRFAIWGVPSEVCHLGCAIWGVPSEVCHLRCAIWGVPSEVCHLRCAIWCVPSEVCHPRCVFKMYVEVNSVKNTTINIWLSLLARKNYMFRPIAAIFRFWQLSC